MDLLPKTFTSPAIKESLLPGLQNLLTEWYWGYWHPIENITRVEKTFTCSRIGVKIMWTNKTAICNALKLIAESYC